MLLFITQGSAQPSFGLLPSLRIIERGSVTPPVSITHRHLIQAVAWRLIGDFSLKTFRSRQMDDPQTIAALVGVIFILIRVVERTFDYARKREVSSLLPEEQQWLKTLYEMHQQFDANGTPIWYVPRSWTQLQQDIAQNMAKLAHHQERIVSCLERLERQLESLKKR
jgi:hypothetical protein